MRETIIENLRRSVCSLQDFFFTNKNGGCRTRQQMAPGAFNLPGHHLHHDDLPVKVIEKCINSCGNKPVIFV